ncbi:hypothetical protein MXD81_21125, partial [Microbacteriaceae bacterium K1510]|nr:hypothetical protein [Microbacteriaceae bacterium K1510]
MDDKINKGLPADRFVLEWMLASDRVEQAVQEGPIDNELWQDYRKLLDWETAGHYPAPVAQEEALGQAGYLIPVPRMIH